MTSYTHLKFSHLRDNQTKCLEFILLLTSFLFKPMSLISLKLTLKFLQQINFEDYILTLQQINSVQDNQAALQRIARLLAETSSQDESFAGSSYHWTDAFLDPAATFFSNYLFSLSCIWGQLLTFYFLYKFCCKLRRQNQQFLTRHIYNTRFCICRRYSQPPGVPPRHSRKPE